MRIDHSVLKKTLFLDIETVSQYHQFSELDDRGKKVWIKKSRNLLRGKEITDDLISETYENKAAIFAEFGKIVCISVGYITKDGGEFGIKLKTYDGEEKELLIAFKEMLDLYYNNPNEDFLCGHNIQEFDIPFICRRMVIHGISLPDILNVAGKKPWQVLQFIDTMVLWRFGDYKNYTSLDLLAYTLSIPTPKDDIDGSMVGKVYYEEKDIERIGKYCEKDVATVIQVVMKYSREDLVKPEHIYYSYEEE